MMYEEAAWNNRVFASAFS